MGGVRITGVGAELPADIVTTEQVEHQAGLHRRFDLEPGWLERMTGVRQRRWAGPDVQPSQLAVAAATRALEHAGLDALDVDTLVFAGITRDALEPATANVVAAALGARRARVFDLLNSCNGLLDALDVADSLIRTGKAERVLVATGERASLAIDWQAATMEELLRVVAGLVVGDGGGAVVLEATDDTRRGLRQRDFRSDVTQWRHAVGGRFRPASEACDRCGGIVDRAYRCDGHDLFVATLSLLKPAMANVMERSGWSYDDLDVILCHQPTKRLVEEAIPLLGWTSSVARRLWATAERFGNTSTAGLPLAMAEAQEAGALFAGAKVLILSPAGGASAAAITMVW